METAFINFANITRCNPLNMKYLPKISVLGWSLHLLFVYFYMSMTTWQCYKGERWKLAQMLDYYRSKLALPLTSITSWFLKIKLINLVETIIISRRSIKWKYVAIDFDIFNGISERNTHKLSWIFEMDKE